MYPTEVEVGFAIKEVNMPREKLCITNKAVVLLAWLMQHRDVAAGTTKKPERLDEHLQAVETKLMQQELHEISDVGSKYHFRTAWAYKFEENDRS